MSAANDICYGTGRRKSAVARAYVKPGSGSFTVNGEPLETYLPRATDRLIASQAQAALDLSASLDVDVKVKGGGSTGQAGAIRLAIARALLKFDETFRKVLKAAGLLTRDARRVERKKVGQPKARKKKQFSKR
jgi:small subunit ribosomal protein S9